MKDWHIGNNYKGQSGKTIHRAILYHTNSEDEMYCSWGNRDEMGWFCVSCKTAAPEEIGFCADLANCYTTDYALYQRNEWG